MAKSVISFSADFKEAERYLTSIEKKQLPFAKAQSLTRTAQFIAGPKRGNHPWKGRGVMQRVLPRIFDRPTRWTLQGFFIEPASKARKKFSAAVRIKDDPAGKVGTPAFNYLQPQAYGTPRRAKSHEKKLRQLGILGNNEFTVPGDGMRLDRFGNLTRQTYSKILADVQGSDVGIDQGYGQATTRLGRKRFFYDPNLRPRGIYRRISRRRLVIALLFVRQPKYRARFDFLGITRRAAVKRLPVEFRKSLSRALATAR